MPIHGYAFQKHWRIRPDHSLVLIDWEYACMSNRYFELATIFIEPFFMTSRFDEDIIISRLDPIINNYEFDKSIITINNLKDLVIFHSGIFCLVWTLYMIHLRNINTVLAPGLLDNNIVTRFNTTKTLLGTKIFNKSIKSCEKIAANLCSN